jgi:hypothetical protein
VRAPLAKFYALFNDEQRARFNAVPSGEDQNEPERRRNLSVCSERASGIASVSIRRMELAVRPDEVQQASLRALRDAVAQAGETDLSADYPGSAHRDHGAAARYHAARDQYRTTCSHSLMSRKSASIGSRACRDDSFAGRGEPKSTAFDIRESARNRGLHLHVELYRSKGSLFSQSSQNRFGIAPIPKFAEV